MAAFYFLGQKFALMGLKVKAAWTSSQVRYILGEFATRSKDGYPFYIELPKLIRKDIVQDSSALEKTLSIINNISHIGQVLKMPAKTWA